MALKLVTGPSMEPVDLQEARLHLRLGEETAEDALLSALIVAAREYCEGFREECFITQTWDYFRDDIPAEVRIPLGQVQYVEFIRVKDSAGTVTEVTFGLDGASPESPVTDSTDYGLDLSAGRARLAKKTGVDAARVTGQINALQVRVVSGYGDDPTDVPERIRAAILLMLAHLYEHRGDENVPAPAVVELLLRPGTIFPMP